MKAMYSAILRLPARTLGVIFVGLGLVTPLAAAGQTPPALVETIDEATLREALDALGADATALDKDARVMRVAFPGGGIAVLRRSACEEGRCRGLLLTSLFAPPRGRDAETARRIARRFSAAFNPASVIINEQGEHLLKGYVILDGGITRKNLAIGISLFALGIAQYGEALYGDAE